MGHKKAFITGITGQDGTYLAKFLIEKGYQVHGLQRRSSLPNTARINSLLQKYHQNELVLHHGDLTDSGSLFQVIESITPDEIYNLAAQSHVAVSFDSPEYSANVNALGTLRLLECMRILGLQNTTRFYQASTSELFGLVQEIPQRETTPFYPRSPYAVSKLYGYWITVNYRESYQMFACNGILFNHESPLRGETFVTRKITLGLARIFLGVEKCLYLGNLDSKRDWGHAHDYVEMQWLILQQQHPEDFVIATGEQHSVREFVVLAAEELGIRLRWEGEGIQEKGIVEAIDSPYPHNLQPGMCIISINPQFFRPAEVDTLLGDPEKAYRKLGWKPKISFRDLVKEMAQADFRQIYQEAKCGEPHLC